MTDDEIIEVVQQHKAGKKIQQRDVDHRELGWRECPFPNWDFYRVDFRAEPEPREWWVYVISGEIESCLSRAKADRRPSAPIRVREVIE